MHKRAKGTQRAEHYHLKAKRLEAKLEKDKEDAKDQLLQWNMEKVVMAMLMKVRL